MKNIVLICILSVSLIFQVLWLKALLDATLMKKTFSVNQANIHLTYPVSFDKIFM